jgi:hypothetical protein
MKKWVIGVVCLLLGVTAVFGFVKYKTGMSPITWFQIKQAGFQMDPAVLQLMATAARCR